MNNEQNLNNVETQQLNIAGVSDSDLVEHNLEDEYGNKFCVKSLFTKFHKVIL